MFKKSLLLGAAILGVSSIACASDFDNSINANNYSASTYSPGPYIGVQGGWGLADEGSGMKDLFDAAYQAAQTDIQEQGFGTAGESTSRGGFAGRAYIGYSFIKYLSAEAGYTYFTDNKYNFNINTLDASGNMNAKFNNYAIDLVGKAILPFDNGLSIYAKLGATYLHTNFNSTFNISGSDLPSVSCNNSWSSVRPTYGAGIAYNFNDNVGVDLSWTGIYGSNSISTIDALGMLAGLNTKPTPTTNMVTLGVSYKFTNLF